MSPVGDERRGPAAQADLAGEIEPRESAFDMPPRGRQAERNDLDRQRKGPERPHQFARIDDHRHPLRGGGDDLLAQERAAAALDQPELEDRPRRRRRPSDRAPEARRASRAECRGSSPASSVASDVPTQMISRPPLTSLSDEIDELTRGRAAAEAELHPGLDEVERPPGRLPLSLISVRRCGHDLIDSRSPAPSRPDARISRKTALKLVRNGDARRRFARRPAAKRRFTG